MNKADVLGSPMWNWPSTEKAFLFIARLVLPSTILREYKNRPC